MNDHHHAIQPDRLIPPPEYAPAFAAEETVFCPPQLPSLERDCKPHRGKLLWSMGIAGLALGGLSIAFFPLALVAGPLSLTAWCLARLDLATIREGLMDPSGERLAYEARNDALAGLVLTCAGIVLWGGMLLCMRP